MTFLRPIAGAVLLALTLASPVLADKVDVITPGGGNAGLIGDSGAAGTTPRAESTGGITGTGGGNSDSDRSLAYEVDTRPTLQTRHFGSQISIACQVASNTDLVVVNQGSDPLPPGTRIKWQLKGERKSGFFAIIGELGGGKTLVADDVLDGRANPGESCVARVI